MNDVSQNLSDLPRSLAFKNLLDEKKPLKKSITRMSTISKIILKKKTMKQKLGLPGWYYWNKFKIKYRSRNLYTSDVDNNNKIIKLDDIDHTNNSNKEMVNDNIKSIIKDTIYDCMIQRYRIIPKDTLCLKLLYLLYIFKSYWDFIICLIITYTLLILPYRLAFNNYHPVFKGVESIFDIILFLDIFYDLRIDLGKMITYKDVIDTNLGELLAIKKNILKMIIRAVLCIPYGLINFELDHIKIIRIIYLNRVSKSFKPILNFFFIQKIRFFHEIRGIIGLIRILLIFIYIAHIVACYWIDISIGYNDTNWYSIYSQDETLHDQLDYYLQSIYFVITTFSTVGYGDIKGKQTREYVYQMLEMFCGIVLYAFLFNEVRYAIKQFNIVENKLINNTDEIYFLLMRLNKRMDTKRFPRSLWLKSNTILGYNAMLKIEDIFLNNEFYQSLSPVIQRELLIRASSNILQIFSWYFEGLSADFIHEFLLRLTPTHYKYGKKLIKCNTKANKLYFIMNSRVYAKSKGTIEPAGYLKKGDILGDHMIFLDTITDYTYRVNHHKSILCFVMEDETIHEFEKRFLNDIKCLRRKIYNRLSIRGEFRFLSRKSIKSKSIINEYNQLIEEKEKRKRSKYEKRMEKMKKISYSQYKSLDATNIDQILSPEDSPKRQDRVSIPVRIPVATNVDIDAAKSIGIPSVDNKLFTKRGKSKFYLPPITVNNPIKKLKNIDLVNQDNNGTGDGDGDDNGGGSGGRITKKEDMDISKPNNFGIIMQDNHDYTIDKNQQNLQISPYNKRKFLEENKEYIKYDFECRSNRSNETDSDYEMESKRLTSGTQIRRFSSIHTIDELNDDHLNLNKNAKMRLQLSPASGDGCIIYENPNDPTNEGSIDRHNDDDENHHHHHLDRHLLQKFNMSKHQDQDEFSYGLLLKKGSSDNESNINNHIYGQHAEVDQNQQPQNSYRKNIKNFMENWLSPILENAKLNTKKEMSISNNTTSVKSSLFSSESGLLDNEVHEEESRDFIDNYLELIEELEIKENEEDNDKQVFYNDDELDDSIDLDIKAMNIYSFQNLKNRIEYLTYKLEFLKKQFLKIKSEKLVEIQNAEIFIKRKLKELTNF